MTLSDTLGVDLERTEEGERGRRDSQAMGLTLMVVEVTSEMLVIGTMASS